MSSSSVCSMSIFSLPTKMFEGGKEFMDRLADEKEKLIDELYEEAYQQKRMYPYMEEDFSCYVYADF